MKTLFITFLILFSPAAFADYISIRSPELRITGDVATQYLRMGHSTFHGTLNVFIYEQARPVRIMAIFVETGHLQGEEQIFSSRANGERGVEAEFNIQQGRESYLRIGDHTIHFVPELTIYHRPVPGRPRPPFPGHH